MRNLSPVIVNSYGRSGSTVLVRAIKQAYGQNSLLNKLKHKLLGYHEDSTAWDLSSANLIRNRVYKTHDYPPHNRTLSTKCIYIYSSPIDVVASLKKLYCEKGEKWMEAHFKHLKVEYKRKKIRYIFDNDVLKLKNHLDSWREQKDIPVLMLKYPDLWEYQEVISEFIGKQIILPKFKKRNSVEVLNKDEIQRLEKTHNDLINYVLNSKPYEYINY